MANNIPAFARPASTDRRGFTVLAQEGMGIREYFAAHAPMPPKSFVPTMPTAPERPPLPDALKSHAVQTGEYLCGDIEIERFEPADLRSALLAFEDERYAWQKKYDTWHAEYEVQRLVQWAYVYADAMIAARHKDGAR